MTVTAVTGTIYLNSIFSGSGITTCRILTQQTASSGNGGTGNYLIDTSQTVASFTGATSTITEINQSGTDTSLAGLSGLTGITTTTIDSTGLIIYNLGFNMLNVTGTLTIGGDTNRYEQLIVGNNNSQIPGITKNGYLHVTGTLNLGATETAGSVSDGYQNQILIYQPGSNKGQAQSNGLGAGSGSYSGMILSVAAGGTLNWKYGTISVWAGIGFNSTANINIGVSGSRKKPVLDFSRARQSGSTTNTQVVYNFGTTNLYGLVLEGGSTAVSGSYGATWAQLKAPANFIGYEPRFCYAGVAGSTAIPAGTYTISNYAGNYGGSVDISKRSSNAVTYNFRNSALGTALAAGANASTGNFLVNAYQDLTVTGYSGAIICFQDTASVFYQATATSGTASFTNILIGAQLNYLTDVWTYYFGTTDTATLSQWAYDRQYASALVQLRGIGGTTATVLSLVDSNVTLSQTAANTLLASNFTVNSSTGTITVRASSTLDQIYDALKAWKCTATQANLLYPTIATQPVNASGTALSTAMNIVVNSGVTLSAGTKFTSLTTSGTFTNSGTLSSGLTITGSVAQATPTDMSGVTITGNLTYNTNTPITVTLTNCTIGGTVSNSGTGAVTISRSGTTIGTVGTNITTRLVTSLNLTIPSGSQIYIADGSGTQQAYIASSGTSYSLDTTGGTGTWTYKVTSYGYTAQTGTHIPASASTTTTVALVADPYITQATKSTVAAYTTLETLDKLYDYSAYYETTLAGISLSRIITKSSSFADADSYDLILNNSGDVWGLVGTTLTIRTTTSFSPGSMITGGLTTTGSITLNAQATSSGTYASLNATTIALSGTANYQTLNATTSISGFPTSGSISLAGSINFGSGTAYSPTGDFDASGTTFAGTLNVNSASNRTFTATDSFGSSFYVNKTGDGTIKILRVGTTAASAFIPGTGVTVLQNVTVETLDGLSISTYIIKNDTIDLGWVAQQTSRSLEVIDTDTFSIYATAYGYQPRVITATGSDSSSFIIGLSPEPYVDTGLSTTTRDAIAATIDTNYNIDGILVMTFNADLRNYTPEAVLGALQYYTVTDGGVIAASVLYGGMSEAGSFTLISGGLLIGTPYFYAQVDNSVTTVSDLGILLPLYLNVLDSVYVTEPTYTPVRKNTSGLILQYAPWTKITANISSADKSDIRDGLATETNVDLVKTNTNLIPGLF
jgi:hypothetical protein